MEESASAGIRSMRARGQDAVAAAASSSLLRLEAFVEDLAACFDSLGAEQLIQPFSLGQMVQAVSGNFLVPAHTASIPFRCIGCSFFFHRPVSSRWTSLTSVSLTVHWPLSGHDMFPNIPTAAAMGVSGQRYVRVLCVQKDAMGPSVVSAGSAGNVRQVRWHRRSAGLPCPGSPCPAPSALLADHAADDDQHNVAAQNDACDGDHTAQCAKGVFPLQFAALAFAKLLRQMFIRHVPAFFFHILPLFCRRSARGFPLSYPADCPYRLKRR